jgi:CRISPR-associated protein (TIGR02710 family)
MVMLLHCQFIWLTPLPLRYNRGFGLIKAMIISVGGTPQPIIKIISEYSPEFISFVASQDTYDLVTQIKGEISKAGLIPKTEITLVDNVNDLVHCYEKAEEAILRVIKMKYKTDEVIVDYTGGTKNMSVAISLAAISHSFSFSYVGGTERTKEGIGIVIDGHEVIYKSINPWDFLAIEAKKNIALLYNQNQFKAARNLTEELQSKSTKYKSMFKKLGFLIEGYYKWDLFRYAEALDTFKKAKLDELMEVQDQSFVSFAMESSNLLHLIEKLARSPRKPSHILIGDLFANAERRNEEGKFDDAVLRLYRIVEMLAQERLLSKYGIDVSDIRKNQIPDSLKEEFAKHYKSQRDGKIKIPQTAAFKLLNELNDEVGHLFRKNEQRFLDLQSSRNYSYLAHGFDCLKERTYNELKCFISDMGIVQNTNIPCFPKMKI